MTIPTAGFISTDYRIKFRLVVYILIVLGSGNPGIAASAGSPIRFKQVEGSIFSFDLWSAGSSMTHDDAGGASLIFTSGLIVKMGYTWGAWLQHRRSCRDAGLRCDQKVNNKSAGKDRKTSQNRYSLVAIDKFRSSTDRIDSLRTPREWKNCRFTLSRQAPLYPRFRNLSITGP